MLNTQSRRRAPSFDALMSVASRRRPPTLLVGDRQATDGLNTVSPRTRRYRPPRLPAQHAVGGDGVLLVARLAGAWLAGLHTAQWRGDQAFHPSFARYVVCAGRQEQSRRAVWVRRSDEALATGFQLPG